MSNINDKTDKGVQMDSKKMDDLQAQLDIEVFEQEEMDVDKVKAILAEMEDYTPDTEKKPFDKEQLWKRIEEQSREEFAEEQIVEFDRIKAGKKRKDVLTGVGGAGRGTKIRRIAAMAAVVVLAIFVGANMGTYATARKSVFEYVGDLKNGTAFWITGDAPSMEFEEEIEVYYSWNDVPNEYKEFLMIPQGLPEDMKLYDIEIHIKDTFDWAAIRYINDDATTNIMIQISSYKVDEFSFANLKYEEKYVLEEHNNVNNIDVYYYKDKNNEITAQCFDGEYVYTFSGKLSRKKMHTIVETTMGINM